jgi:hypothetical protein
MHFSLAFGTAEEVVDASNSYRLLLSPHFTYHGDDTKFSLHSQNFFFYEINQAAAQKVIAYYSSKNLGSGPPTANSPITMPFTVPIFFLKNTVTNFKRAH